MKLITPIVIPCGPRTDSATSRNRVSSSVGSYSWVVAIQKMTSSAWAPTGSPERTNAPDSEISAVASNETR